MVHDAVLNIDYASGLVSYHPNARRSFEEPRRVRSFEYSFNYIMHGDKIMGWQENSTNQKFFTSKELADFIIKNLIQVIRTNIK